MFFYVYVLESGKSGGYYIGYTHDLKKRIEEHNRGLSEATRPYLPWKLIYYEVFKSKIDAQREEEFLKTGKGRERLNFLLKDVFFRWH